MSCRRKASEQWLREDVCAWRDKQLYNGRRLFATLERDKRESAARFKPLLMCTLASAPAPSRCSGQPMSHRIR